MKIDFYSKVIDVEKGADTCFGNVLPQTAYKLYMRLLNRRLEKDRFPNFVVGLKQPPMDVFSCDTVSLKYITF